MQKPLPLLDNMCFLDLSTLTSASDPSPITRKKLQYTLAREVLGLLREERDKTMKELQSFISTYRQEQGKCIERCWVKEDRAFTWIRRVYQYILSQNRGFNTVGGCNKA